MGYLESAVVVYLRSLYYPSGLYFPMPSIDFIVGITELGRELATMVMLIAIAFLLGKNALQRFGYFLYVFAIWDIFYYVFLRILVQWPASLFDWDVLFLVPVVWASPVICPLIVSVSMMVLALFLIIGVEKNKHRLINGYGWILLIVGSCIVLSSFTIDYIKYMSVNNSIITFEENRKIVSFANYIPGAFNWVLFFIGEFIIVAGIISIRITYLKTKVE
jgi:hypothetical protein